MSEQTITTGELVSAFLEACGVQTAFGVVSIHNLPMLDAIGRRGKIRFVPSRGEAGAVNMADGYARTQGALGVAFTSTGTGAGNAAGALIEAETAGTPLLHLTGQIDLPYLDRGRGYIHEAKAQLGMLRSISKAVYRVWSPESALGVLREAVRTALTAPTGPVSVEIPADIQAAMLPQPDDFSPLHVPISHPGESSLDQLAERLATAKRPLLWLGGGARHAREGAIRLVECGMGMVTSVNGRGIVPEDHPLTLGAFNMNPDAEAFYQSCDLMLVVGSRLRSNETKIYRLKLPEPLLQVDADPVADGRAYPNSGFVCGDSAVVLSGLADRLEGRLQIDPAFAQDLASAREAAVAKLQDTLGPYDALVDALKAVMPPDALWVRDVTILNSTWGNRLPKISDPRNGIHALGGGIGQGMPMGVGAALGADGRKVVSLCGDGGLMLNIGELTTAVQEQADLTLLVMNDQGYGVIRNIQDARFGGRHYFTDLRLPDFATLAKSLGMPYWSVTAVSEFGEKFQEALSVKGPALVEVEMQTIGPFKVPFAGPPVKTE